MYDIESQIGSGTFSKVYLGRVKGLDDALMGREKSPLVAIKVVTPFSDPKRVRREIEIMNKADGILSVIPLYSAVVSSATGTGAMIMPYFHHRNFSEYYNKLTMEKTKWYIRTMLDGLAHLHSLNILHRDVKPPNFLFDPETGEGKLVDFGLSEFINHDALKDINRENIIQCNCGKSRSMVCNICCRKAAQKVNRAGTPGFRPPEVLLKYHRQDAKLDVWAAGVCFISILARRFPYFPAVDDLDALAQICQVVGTDEVTRTARKLGKRFETSKMSEPSYPLAEVVRLQRLNSTREAESDPETSDPEKPQPTIDALDDTNSLDWHAAVDLLTGLLICDPDKRSTSADALDHDFLA